MRRHPTVRTLLLITALLVALGSIVVHHAPHIARAALPATLNPASPSGTDPVSSGDDEIRAFKQFVADVFGLPTSPTAVTGAIGSTSADGTIQIYRLNGVVNVMGYGCVGDGVANDTTCIANALTAADGGKGLVFPPGTYLTDPFTIAAGGTVPAFVVGYGATLKARGAGTLVTLENVHTDVRQFRLAGFVLDGNSFTGTRGLKVHGGQNMHVADLEVHSFSSDGVWLSGESGFGIYYSVFRNVRSGRSFGTGNRGNGWTIKSIGAGNFIASITLDTAKSVYNYGHGFDVDWASLACVGCEAEKNDGAGWNYDNTFDATLSGGYSEANHQDYAHNNVSDGTTDTSFTLTANSTGFKIFGGRHIGSVTGTTNGTGNVFLHTNPSWALKYDENGDLRIGRHLTIANGGGIGIGGATAAADVLNAGADLSLQRSGTTVAQVLASTLAVPTTASLSLKRASPAQITADQNDYNPGAGGFQRLSSDASRTITGLAGGLDGRLLILANVGAQNIVLANENAGSAAANRIITGTAANITLAADDTATLIYDASSSRWRVINTH